MEKFILPKVASLGSREARTQSCHLQLQHPHHPLATLSQELWIVVNSHTLFQAVTPYYPF